MRTEDTIFPSDAFSTPRMDGAFYEEWYGKHMRSLEEGSLHSVLPDVLTIRFLWLRTFHAPVVVRVAGPPWSLEAKVTNGQGGYEPGTIVHRDSRELTADEGQSVQSHFGALEFWSRDRPPESVGCDGAQWILEAATPNKYRVIHDWSPTHGPLRDFCLLLLGLGRIDLTELY